MEQGEKKQKQAAELNVWLNKNFKIVGAVIFVIILLLGLLLFIYPKYQAVSQSSQADVPSQQAELAILDNYESKVVELEKLINTAQSKYAAEVKILEQILPDEPNIPELIAQTDALVQRSGFKISALSFTNSELDEKELSKKRPAKPDAIELALPPLGKNIQAVNITLNVAGGDYNAFKILLDKIEKNIRLLDIVSVGFTSGNGQMDYTLALRTYYLSAVKAVLPAENVEEPIITE
ncbi:MAG: hypothetical protein WCV73_01330 [Patescibacteria group bacterium]